MRPPVEFAQRCGIPLRSFKRFEAGACDSLTILLKVAQYFNRAPGLEMLFPAALLPKRGMQAALQSIRQKLDDRVVTGEAILDELVPEGAKDSEENLGIGKT